MDEVKEGECVADKLLKTDSVDESETFEVADAEDVEECDDVTVFDFDFARDALDEGVLERSTENVNNEDDEGVGRTVFELLKNADGVVTSVVWEVGENDSSVVDETETEGVPSMDGGFDVVDEAQPLADAEPVDEILATALLERPEEKVKTEVLVAIKDNDIVFDTSAVVEMVARGVLDLAGAAEKLLPIDADAENDEVGV